MGDTGREDSDRDDAERGEHPSDADLEREASEAESKLEELEERIEKAAEEVRKQDRVASVDPKPGATESGSER